MTPFDGVPFFAELSPAKIEAHARRCRRERHSEGALILDYEDSSTDVYFIVHGEVRVLIRTASGREMILGDLEAGRFFGEMAAIDGMRRSANVTALTNAELFVVPGADFCDIVMTEPRICERLLRLLTTRIRDLDRRLFEHNVLDLRHRLYAELLRLAAPRKSAPEQSVVSPPPRHQDLASRIGCRREQVSRELTHMLDEGLIEKSKGGLVLLRPATIQKRLSEMLNRAE